MGLAGTKISGRSLSRTKLAGLLTGKLIGTDGEVEKLSDPKDAGPTDVVCVLRQEYLDAALKSQANLIVLDTEPTIKTTKNLLLVANTEIAWQKLLEIFAPPLEATPGIHESATVHPEAEIATGVCIAANVVIERAAKISEGCIIMAGAYIGERTILGKNCSIHPNAVLRHDVQLGENVLVQSGAVIGSDGFGFRRDEQGKHWRLTHIGSVIIEDDVEIGTNCVIDRGTVGETRIGARSKLGPGCIVAHNGKIGSDVLLIGAVQLAGSVTIGNRAVLFGQVGSAGHVQIGEAATVTAQSGISKDLEAGGTYRGSPAQPIRDQLRLEARLRDIEQLSARIIELEKKVGS